MVPAWPACFRYLLRQPECGQRLNFQRVADRDQAADRADEQERRDCRTDRGRREDDRHLGREAQRALEERDALAKQLRELNARRLEEDAKAKAGAPPRGVAEWAAERARDDVRAFVLACLSAGAPWVVSAAGAPDPVVVAARAKGAGPATPPSSTGCPSTGRRHGKKGIGSKVSW